jgi:hypothetical protein
MLSSGEKKNSIKQRHIAGTYLKNTDKLKLSKCIRDSLKNCALSESRCRYLSEFSTELYLIIIFHKRKNGIEAVVKVSSLLSYLLKD